MIGDEKRYECQWKHSFNVGAKCVRTDFESDYGRYEKLKIIYEGDGDQD